MMLIPASQQSLANEVGVSVLWTIKERRSGLWVPVHRFHNLLTNYGLTAMAAAPSGQYVPPTYLVIDQAYVTMFTQANPGSTSIQLTSDPTIAGDTQLVLSAGLAAQEVVTITGPGVGTNPSTFTLSAATANTHLAADPVVRQVSSSDTMSSVLSEAQYDPTFNANSRSAMTSAYSPGTAQNTMQFFISGATATGLFFAHVGLADQQSMTAINTNLHNYAVLGYNHNNTNDLEIDVLYTLQTF